MEARPYTMVVKTVTTMVTIVKSPSTTPTPSHSISISTLLRARLNVVHLFLLHLRQGAKLLLLGWQPRWAGPLLHHLISVAEDLRHPPTTMHHNMGVNKSTIKAREIHSMATTIMAQTATIRIVTPRIDHQMIVVTIDNAMTVEVEVEGIVTQEDIIVIGDRVGEMVLCWLFFLPPSGHVVHVH
jgi:hypothetical protein